MWSPVWKLHISAQPVFSACLCVKMKLWRKSCPYNQKIFAAGQRAWVLVCSDASSLKNWSETSQEVGCTLRFQPISVSSVNKITITQHSAQAEWVEQLCRLYPSTGRELYSEVTELHQPSDSHTSSTGPTWSCWTSGSGRCSGATVNKLSPTGVCSLASACASPSWDPPSWTWGVRPSPPCSRSPGSSSPSSSSCWWAAAWGDSSRKREYREC